MLPFCREYDTSQNCMYRPAIEYGHPEVEIIGYEYDRQDVEFVVGGAGSENTISSCVTHTHG